MGCITSRDRWPPWPKRGRDVLEEIEVTVLTSTGPTTIKKLVATPEWVWPCDIGCNNGGGNEKVDADYKRNDASQSQQNNIRAMEDKGG